LAERLTDQAIRFLVECSFPVVPSKGSVKGPCVPWKMYQEQLPTVEQIHAWGKKFHPERWGLVTGRLSRRVVIDFDGEQGLERMRMWGIKPHLRTGSGGYHCHLLHPGWRVPTMNAKSAKACWPWPGVDIRGDGGFAVLLGRNGNGLYVQLRDLDPERFDVLPHEVRAFLQQAGNPSETPKRIAPRSQPIQPVESGVDPDHLVRDALEIALRSGRNNAGFWLACQLRDNGYDRSNAESATRSYLLRVGSTNTKGQRERYTEREMLASLSQAYSASAREPWKRRSRPQGAAESSKHSREQSGSKNVNSTVAEQEHNADRPDSIGIYVGHTGEPLLGHMGEPLSREQYSRIPREVLSDRRLNGRDIRVYAVLAVFCWQGSVAAVGKRLIAKRAGCAERLVVASLKHLEVTGHIHKTAVKRGQRGIYHLLSPVFGQKQRAGLYEMVVSPDGRRRLASVRKDPEIARTARG
jgi:hypothetical protein